MPVNYEGYIVFFVPRPPPSAARSKCQWRRRFAAAVFEKVLEKFPGLSSHRLLFSVNQEYVSSDTKIRDGDELAVFTAVSGG